MYYNNMNSIYLVILVIFLIISNYLFNMDINITIVSCLIIIIMLFELLDKKKYEGFTANIYSIDYLQNEYLKALLEIEKRFSEKIGIIKNEKEKVYKIPIKSSNFNEGLETPRCECNNLNINNNQLSNIEFINLISAIKKNE